MTEHSDLRRASLKASTPVFPSPKDTVSPMSVTTPIGSLEDTVAFAQSGNRLLAELQLRRLVLEDQSAIENPAVWLWMAWLSDSPQAMVQVMVRLLERDPSNELARAGAIWARGLAQLNVSDLEINGQSTTGTLAAGVAPHSAVIEERLNQVESLVEAVQQDYGAAVSNAQGNSWLNPSALFALPEASESAHVAQTESPLDTAETTEAELGSDSVEVAVPSPTEPHVVEQQIRSLFSQFDQSAKPAPRDKAPAPAGPASLSGQVFTIQNEAVPPTAARQSPGGTLPAPRPEVSLPTAAESRLNMSEPVASGPQARVPQSPEAKLSEGQRPSNSILVVDDSPTVRRLLTLMLSQCGYQVSTANDGLDAVKSIAANSPDLIITDINMPRLDGFKLCKLVTRSDKTKHIPVIMISSGVIDRLRGKLAGCTDYLTKPITLESLLAVVESSIVSSLTRSK